MAPIDTFSYYKMLEDAGTPHKQAEVLVKMWSENLQHNLATKGDTLKIEEKITQIGERIIVVEERIAKVEERLIVVEERIAKVEERIITIEERLSKVEEKIEHLRKDVLIEIGKCKYDMIKWVVSLLFAQSVAIISAIGWLFNLIK